MLLEVRIVVTSEHWLKRLNGMCIFLYMHKTSRIVKRKDDMKLFHITMKNYILVNIKMNEVEFYLLI